MGVQSSSGFGMKLQRQMQPARLVIRYILSLALLVMFVLGGHGLHIATGKQGILDEEVLNISGRQRMLSQRIVLTATRYNDTADAEYAEILQESVSQFDASNEWLAEHALVPDTAVYAHYFGTTGTNLYERSIEFAEHARAVLSIEPGTQSANSAIASLEQIALVDLLRDLNIAVALFEDAANERAQTLERIQFAAVVATLVIIVLEVLLIFYPAHRTMDRMIRRLRYQAWHDELTGLINRAEFVERIKRLAERRPKSLDQVLLFGLDLDGFKQINDTLGHPAGDLVLQNVADRIRAVVGSFDGITESHVARVGGDEFLIGLRTNDPDPSLYAKRLGGLLIDAVQQPIAVEITPGQTAPCSVGVSIGFCTASSTNGDIEAALGDADIALYQSKRGGKGCTTEFIPKMRAEIEEEHRVEQRLKTAIRGLEFRSFFQPQIDMTTGKLVGVEALARWNDPERGVVNPANFIEVAETVGLIDALDGQIALHAFQEYRRCESLGFDLGTLSINTSGLALRDLDFCEVLVNVAAAHEMAPSQVTVEILENILVCDEDPALESIRRLSNAGFGIAVDDFGVGFSSLARVGRMNVSAIKIDRSLTAEAEDPNMRKILQATSAMADGLGARLYVEGIETEAQRHIMAEMGACVGQGYLWSAPVSADDLCDLIRREHRYRLAVV